MLILAFAYQYIMMYSWDINFQIGRASLPEPPQKIKPQGITSGSMHILLHSISSMTLIILIVLYKTIRLILIQVRQFVVEIIIIIIYITQLACIWKY